MSKAMTLLDGRYAIVRQISAGGNARILEAEDVKLGRPVAIKMLAPAFSSMAEATERLDREARLCGSVAHPNVCALLDRGHAANGSPYLVFELLHGDSLADRLTHVQTFPVDQAVRIAEQLLSAVGAVHERGIVHRDIKPANVFLSNLLPGTPLVKLLDFGTAHVPGDEVRDGSQLTSTGFVVGTAEYMSPEQVRGLRDFDARTDIYSVGVVLYEMLSGKRPFANLALAELLHSIAFERVRPLAEVAPRVPRVVAHAVDVALANDRERRHADARAFISALRATSTPPMTAATRIVPAAVKSDAVIGVAEPSDWDMKTHETGPPSDFADVDEAGAAPNEALKKR